MLPTWAGRPCVYMLKYLRTTPFKGKKVHIIGSCGSSYKDFFGDVKQSLDGSNTVVNEVMFTHEDLEKMR